MTPHQKIMRAARCRAGVKFTPEEVRLLASDAAIESRAAHDAEVRYERSIIEPRKGSGKVK